MIRARLAGRALLALELILPLALLAQGSGNLKLIHADSAFGYVENGRLVRELIGRVEFVQDTSRMYCDRAIQYPEEGLALFSGGVRIVTPPRELRAEQIYHYDLRREQIACGHARMTDKKQVLTADTLRYIEKEDRALAQGHATISDSTERASLSGRRIEYLRLKGYARVDGEPVFVRRDSTGTDSLVIRSRLMEMFEDGQRIQAREEVTMNQGLVSATCGELLFSRKEEKITLKLQPQARRDQDHLRGTEIDLLLRQRTLRGIGIRGNAVVVTRIDTLVSPEAKHDYLSGETVYVGINGNSIDSVYVSGRATSYYHLFDGKKYQGMNKVLGDELMMSFREGRVRRVGVKSDPAASNGIFFPHGQQAALLIELEALLLPFQLKPERLE